MGSLEVNLEEELVSALKEIDKLGVKNKKKKEKLKKKWKEGYDTKEIEKTFIILKTQLEEEKRIEEVVRI
jgi:hypothetical protein